MAVSGAYCTISSCPRRLLPIPRCGPSSSSKPTLKLQSLASSTLLAFGAGAALAMSAFLSPGEALAALEEPTNALSLPTWAIHVSSVVEWVTAMVLVWEYGEKSGFEAWKGLSWGMVPLLGGALCACTWHFFYNSESLEVLVAMQAGLTVIGNMTMCFAAFRIFKASQEGSTKS
ncbi:uncharacterized protein A4U43_C07F26510 [Asparagus officinalis]|uniref:Ycf49-like protein n=1 Tax=Asparagus officinalis TaxID=4686 RepID=A0A5P1EKA6_ASPOF|nr:uncharacterized protein LOC109850432 [Asparagus officinalis]ONK64480.1 uncharacterized protein A4U43_C07F26510 [Asparagus officinalis]